MAFSDSVVSELMRLREGDRLAAQGALKIELYTAKDGTTKINRTVFADNVLALRGPPKERQQKTPQQQSHDDDGAPGKARSSGMVDDDIPF